MRIYFLNENERNIMNPSYPGRGRPTVPGRVRPTVPGLQKIEAKGFKIIFYKL